MPPVDVFAEAEGLKRRRALLEALQQRAAVPQIQGPPKAAIGQLLASLGQSYFTSKGLSGIDQQQAALAGRQQEGLNSEMAAMLEQMQGQPGMHELPPDQAGPQVPGVPGDPMAAVMSAMTSRHPQMQGIGKQMLPEMLKSKVAPQPKRETRFAPDGTLMTLEDGVPINTGPRGEYAKPPNPAVVIDNVGSAGKRILEKEYENLAPGGQEYERARGAKEKLQTITEAIGQISLGASSGQAEPFIQAVRKLGERLGIENANIAPTDALGSAMAKQTLATASALKGALSDADMQFLKDGTGSISTNPQALKRIMALSAKLAWDDVQAYNQGVRGVASQGAPFDLLQRHAPDFAWQGPEDEEFLSMFERALAGKPTVAPAPPPPAPTPPARPSSPIRYTPRGG